MTEEEKLNLAIDWIRSQGWDEENLPSDELLQMKKAYLAGFRAGSENYSKIYMLGRKDERERPSDLCKNLISICKRCDCHKTLCEGSDFGAYIGECESFVYKEVSE